MTKTAVPKKVKKLLDPAAVITRSVKSILNALGPDVTVVVAVADTGYDINIRLGTADAVADEVLKLTRNGKGALVIAGAKPRRRTTRQEPKI